MPLKTIQDDPPTLNLTSMIDVLFLLIIFFMVGTRFADAERKIDLSLPQVHDAGALAEASPTQVVHVYQDGTIHLNERAVSLDELTAGLKTARRQYQGQAVLVRGDGTGQFQRVAEVLNACKQAGIGELAISVTLDGASR